MAIATNQNGLASDFITKAERNATPSNDSGRVPQMESDGYISQAHMEAPNAVDIVIGEAFTGATTPQPAYISDSDGKAYRCDANDTSKMKFVGFVVTSGSTNDTERLILSGLVRGFTGLSAGEKYYLSDSVGTISSSPGTYEVVVGIAINSTTLFIHKGRRMASGVTSFADSGTTTVTVGFRPSAVRIHAYLSTTADLNNSHGGWDAFGGAKCVYNKNGSAGTSSSLSWDLQNSGSNGHNGVVDDITDTSFRLSNTEVGSGLTVYIYWQAEGEL